MPAQRTRVPGSSCTCEAIHQAAHSPPPAARLNLWLVDEGDEVCARTHLAAAPVEAPDRAGARRDHAGTPPDGATIHPTSYLPRASS